MKSPQDRLYEKAGEVGLKFALFNFSPSSRYALSAVSFLARQDADAYVAIEDIAKSQDLPQSFLAKILKQLANQGITVALHGPGGGYALGRSPERISLADVISAVEAPAAGQRQCQFELHGCGGASPCAMHDEVCRAERQLWEALGTTTIAQYSIAKFRGDMQ